MRSTVERRRAEGWCIYCGEAYPEEGKSGCTACLKKRTEDARKRDRDNQQQGRCRCGGVRAKGRFQCKKCLTRRAAAWDQSKLTKTIAATMSLGQRAENISERLNVASAIARDPRLLVWSEALAEIAKNILDLPNVILSKPLTNNDDNL